MTTHTPIPVKGYKPVSDRQIAIANDFKITEERILRQIEHMERKNDGSFDPRFLAIAKTEIQKAFMAVNRAVFNPGRVVLPEDGDGDDS